ncbi:MAG TPA: PilZ domain-containing protein [Vicinamibacterales bacterium]|nr:PilZ domain-containing protein [Vicinamibacterales bacterium]
MRLNAEDASWLRSARLKYGAEVRVIDISTGGILVDSDGAPLAPQSNIVFELSAQTGKMLMPARVLRSERVEGSTRHQTACAFKRALSVDALAAVTRDESPTPAATAAPTAARTSWQRVVARFRSGQIVRGYTNDFHPSKTHLHLTPEDKPEETMFVAVSQLKAVFFVRKFEGDSSRVDRHEFENAQYGRRCWFEQHAGLRLAGRHAPRQVLVTRPTSSPLHCAWMGISRDKVAPD